MLIEAFRALGLGSWTTWRFGRSYRGIRRVNSAGITGTLGVKILQRSSKTEASRPSDFEIPVRTETGTQAGVAKAEGKVGIVG